MSDSTWTVHPHGALEALSPRVRRVQAPIPGMGLVRVMTVAKRADERLVIHNGIALEASAMEELEAWGEPAFLVVPSGYHRMDAAAYKARYPNITVMCPRGAEGRVAKVVPVDLTYDAYDSDDVIRFEHLDGVGEQEGAMIVVDVGGATVVLNDALFNLPHGSGLKGFVFRHITQSSGGPRVSRVFRWFVMKDREQLRASLRRLADTPNLKRVIVAHHRVILDDPAGALRRAADAL